MGVKNTCNRMVPYFKRSLKIFLTVARSRVIMNAIVFYFGIHILVVKSNLIPNNGSDNSGLTFNKVNNNDPPSSISKANTFDEMNDEIRIARNRKFLNERNSNMTRKKVIKREITPITSSQTVPRITQADDTDFRTAVTQGKFVVDKTRFIPKLLKFGSRRQRIMLRPYRFGKSFFLSMLRAFFQGDRNLYCSNDRPKMDICNNSDLTWEEYPILNLNFGGLFGRSLSVYIRDKVVDLAKKYGVGEMLPEDINDLIEQTFTAIYKNKTKGVVILVDEYDLPVMKTYFDDNVAIYKLNEEMIEGFFGALKSVSAFIHFAFIFGATKVTTVGKTHNLLEDLTGNKDYSDLVGFTKEEIMKTYKERLAEIAHERNLENVEMLFEGILHPYYNSYQFTRFGIFVFNPLSVTYFLIENPEKPKPYWAKNVEDETLLKHTVKKFSNNTLHLLSGESHPFKSDIILNGKLNRDNIMRGDMTELAKMLFQTGHMTIKEPALSSSYCDLGVVNEEAKYIFERYLQQKVHAGPLDKMDNMLQQYKFEEFIKALEDAIVDLLGDEHYQLEVKYEMIVSILLELRSRSPADWESAVLTSAMMKQFVIKAEENSIKKQKYVNTTKYADYIKIMPFSKVTTIFYFKIYVPGETTKNTTFELMKCHSAYVKPYADEHPENEVMCIVLIFYTGASQREKVRKNQRIKDTKREFIMDWAALRWLQEEKKVQEYNIHPALNDEQREEVAAYTDKDQQKKKQDSTVPKKKPDGQVTATSTSGRTTQHDKVANS